MPHKKHHIPQWFSESNISTIIGYQYNPNSSTLQDEVENQLEEHREILDFIVRQTGFTYSNIAIMMAGSKKNAATTVLGLEEHLLKILELLNRKTFEPSVFATLLRGKAKRINEVLPTLERRWADLETIAKATSSTKLASALSGKSIDKLEDCIDAALFEANRESGKVSFIEAASAPPVKGRSL